MRRINGRKIFLKGTIERKVYKELNPPGTEDDDRITIISVKNLRERKNDIVCDLIIERFHEDPSKDWIERRNKVTIDKEMLGV